MPCSDHTAGSAHPFASSEWWMLPDAAPWQSSVRDKIEHAATQQFITAALEEECSTAFTDNVDLLRLAFRARRDPSVATPRARVGELRGSVAVDAPPAARLFMPLDLLPPPPFRRRETCPTSKGAMEDRWLSVNPISTTPRRSAREVRVTALGALTQQLVADLSKRGPPHPPGAVAWCAPSWPDAWRRPLSSLSL